jgi:hypothetical protein
MDHIAEAAFLEKYFKSKEKAIEHARWAYFNAEKQETQYFWLQVIKELGGTFD